MTKLQLLLFAGVMLCGCRSDVPENFRRGYDQCLLTSVNDNIITYECEKPKTYAENKEPTR